MMDKFIDGGKLCEGDRVLSGCNVSCALARKGDNKGNNKRAFCKNFRVYTILTHLLLKGRFAGKLQVFSEKLLALSACLSAAL